jgi:hypothetical protein
MSLHALLLLAVLGLLAGDTSLHAQARELTPAEQKAADMRMPDLDRSALEPEKREPAEVMEEERNPFGLVSLPPTEVEETATIQAETEEMRLRRILGNMRVSGSGGTAGSYSVLLGSMRIRAGDKLPKLFADQAEILTVTSITDREITLSFQENDPNVPPRTIGLGYDLRPRPRSLLPGELFRRVVPFTAKGAPDLKPLEVPAVKNIAEGAEAAGLQGLTERSFELMGEPEFRANEKTTEAAGE